MQSAEDLRETLRRIDARGYKAYKDIEGVYNFNEYTLFVDHVQGAPFASPSRMRVRVPQNVAGFPREAYYNKSRQIALCDFLTRKFFEASRRFCKGKPKKGFRNKSPFFFA